MPHETNLRDTLRVVDRKAAAISRDIDENLNINGIDLPITRPVETTGFVELRNDESVRKMLRVCKHIAIDKSDHASPGNAESSTTNEIKSPIRQTQMQSQTTHSGLMVDTNEMTKPLQKDKVSPNSNDRTIPTAPDVASVDSDGLLPTKVSAIYPSALIYPRRRSTKRVRRSTKKQLTRTRCAVIPEDFKLWAIAAFMLLFLCHAWLWYCAFEVAGSEFPRKT